MKKQTYFCRNCGKVLSKDDVYITIKDNGFWIEEVRHCLLCASLNVITKDEALTELLEKQYETVCKKEKV